ncbi:hypothetical protein [Bacillus cereus]|uniref:hypothetical protein n=1 Tax=Bacillus cereus TaxID=1396 RepID=UPI003CFDAE84
MSTDAPKKCPVPWIHPDDLVASNHPGMNLTAAEERDVEAALSDALAEDVNDLLRCMTDRTVLLHPIPAGQKERADWRRDLSSHDGGQYIALEAERSRYLALCKASAAKDWTTILTAFTTGPGNRNETPAGRKVQPIRDALEARRTRLRKEAAVRVGCICV